MRISDWSSDVCSSDLSARSADLPEGVCGRSGAIGVGIFPGGLVSCLWASMPCFRERRFERKNRVAAPSVAPIDSHDQCQERHVMELENKTNIVTAESIGIASAAAKLFASEGDTSVTVARSCADVEALGDASGTAQERSQEDRVGSTGVKQWK